MAFWLVPAGRSYAIQRESGDHRKRNVYSPPSAIQSGLLSTSVTLPVASL